MMMGRLHDLMTKGMSNVFFYNQGFWLWFAIT
ncbi:hypothetical protein LVISKB_1482 [Levilactobacillus brevis KB290]|uniref:Uncharacterized protein n=1 Tax=Levilactobacillus brevis KB290 TaxID=1001583 RepID=M5AFN5_LEVBR|nr:hypothetical protein LVISKB_1482 [Levilactobacillus brevis KB290]